MAGYFSFNKYGVFNNNNYSFLLLENVVATF